MSNELERLEKAYFEAEEILTALGFKNVNSKLADNYINPYNPHIRIYREKGSQYWILTDGSGSINDNEKIRYDDLISLKRYAAIL